MGEGQQVRVLLKAANERLDMAEVLLRKADRERPGVAQHVWLAVAEATSAGLLMEAAARRGAILLPTEEAGEVLAQMMVCLVDLSSTEFVVAALRRMRGQPAPAAESVTAVAGEVCYV